MSQTGLTTRLCLLTGSVFLSMLGAVILFARDALPIENGTLVLIGGIGLSVVAYGTARLTSSLQERLRQAGDICERFSRGVAVPHLNQTGPVTVSDFARRFNQMLDSAVDRVRELQDERDEYIESSRLLETILETSYEAVLAVNNQKEIIFVNRAANTLLRIPVHSVGKHLGDFSRDPQLDDVLTTVIRDQKEVQEEFELKRTGLICDVRACRLSGDPSPGVVVMLHDVTGLRSLEQMRTNFVSNVSHELKTPLASIQAYTETLQDGAMDDVVFRDKFLENISQQAARLHTLILDLLELARLESRESSFHHAPLLVSDVVHGCVDEYRPAAERKSVTLSVTGENCDAQIDADAEAVRSLVGNLVENALNYTPEGGTVAVRLTDTPTDVAIEIEDSGVGIPEEHLSRIFERFYRVDKARSRELGGTGLGLAIVKHFVKLLGGRIDVRSEVGQGTCFRVSIPRCDLPVQVALD